MRWGQKIFNKIMGAPHRKHNCQRSTSTARALRKAITFVEFSIIRSYTNIFFGKWETNIDCNSQLYSISDELIKVMMVFQEIYKQINVDLKAHEFHHDSLNFKRTFWKIINYKCSTGFHEQKLWHESNDRFVRILS